MTRTRVAAALAAVVIAGLIPAFSVFMQLTSAPDWQPAPDTISTFEQHYAALREAVRGQREVGYLPPPAKTPSTALSHFYLTRYTLAPVQVMVESPAPLAVADAIVDRSRLPADFTVRQDFGNGLLLLERKPQ